MKIFIKRNVEFDGDGKWRPDAAIRHDGTYDIILHRVNSSEFENLIRLLIDGGFDDTALAEYMVVEE